MPGEGTISFVAELWMWSGKGAWFFLTLPEADADRVRFFAGTRPGFGSVRVSARIGKTAWQTSLFPDKKTGSFQLPVKADVRAAEGLAVGNSVAVTIEIAV